jgi:hypothetical protein
VDKLLDAFTQWPTDQQMSFAIAALIVLSVLSLVFGWWGMMLLRDMLYYVTVWFRGWPEDQLRNEKPTLIVNSPEAVTVRVSPLLRLANFVSWLSAGGRQVPQPAFVDRQLDTPPRPAQPITTNDQRIGRSRREVQSEQDEQSAS